LRELKTLATEAGGYRPESRPECRAVFLFTEKNVVFKNLVAKLFNTSLQNAVQNAGRTFIIISVSITSAICTAWCAGKVF
jgi:hypothetical protein